MQFRNEKKYKRMNKQYRNLLYNLKPKVDILYILNFKQHELTE